MRRIEAMAALEARIGYGFKARALLEEALTHSSAAEGRPGEMTNERLEFLGDRVLGLIAAEELLRRFPELSEAMLAPRFNALVNRAACAEAAQRAELGAALHLSRAEADAGGRAKEAILADACEALIAALYLDGGFDAARAFVLRFWGDAFEAVKSQRKDPKTSLQEWAAARRAPLTYRVIARSGPDHAPMFEIEVAVGVHAPARGEGRSKREAEQAAAAAMLRLVGADE